MTKARIGATTRIVSEVNKTAIVQTLQTQGPLTLQQLREETGLSPATVNRIVDRLRSDDLIIDAGAATSSGGRPPRLLGFNSRRHSVIAIDIGARKISGNIFDLQGNHLSPHTTVVSIDQNGPDTASEAFEQVAQLCHELFDLAAAQGSPARAIGIGVPGMVRSDSGIVQFAPSVQWWDLPLASLLAERLGIPVVVENDVNLIALAEHRFGAARGCTNSVTFAIGTGVGAGVIINGEVYRGSLGGAGEVGYMLMDVDSLQRPWPGFGDLESRVSGRTLVEQVRETIGSQESELTHPRDALAILRAGDDQVEKLFKEFLDYIAMAVANISVVLNPEVVVFAGGAGVEIVEGLIPHVRARLQGRIPLVPQLRATEVKDVELIGASQVAIEEIQDFSYVTDRS